MALSAPPIPLFPDVLQTVGNASVIVGRGWSVVRHQVFVTLIDTLFSGREVAMYQQSVPVWQFDLTYPFMRDQTQNNAAYGPYTGLTEFEAISRLFNWCAATRGSFYFEDRSDNSRTGQIIGTGDGVTNPFNIVRTLNWGNAVILTETVGAVNLNHPVNVYINGVLQDPSTYSITGNQITFTSVPAPGVTISMDFWFYYVCHFVEDQQQYSEFMKSLWELGKCRFRSLLNEAIPITFTLTLSTAGGDGFDRATSADGMLAPPPETRSYPANAIVVLTATPHLTDDFFGWTGDVPVGHNGDNPLTITMDQNRAIVANFGRTIALPAVHFSGPQAPCTDNIIFGRYQIGTARGGAVGGTQGIHFSSPAQNLYRIGQGVSTSPCYECDSSHTLLIALWFGNLSTHSLLDGTLSLPLFQVGDIAQTGISDPLVTIKAGPASFHAPSVFNAGWHSLAISIDFTTQVVQVALDRTILTPSAVDWSVWGDPLQHAADPYGNGQGLLVGSLGAIAGAPADFDLSDVWLNYGEAFFDLTVTSNLNLLFSTGNTAISWGAGGTGITGNIPVHYLSGNASTYGNGCGINGPYIPDIPGDITNSSSHP